ncbi:hypothetical protein FIBSPDRAFT_731732 [Athelia psychrophila]|uniref:ER transporter 6TM N-terminal domain-containing protein n=1 Tax=Athelia psychrophila TaxID=1759441 RepID=A0A166Q5Q2_9AGAM|nr:hypothetical protein FIBSPDRAFT_731732 [Fibularhizoctonia sp. CBS 109695]
MKTQSFSEHDSAEKHESQVNGHENEVENEVEKSPKKSFIDKLPGWVGFHLRNPGSWKVLARCWLGSWIAVVVLLPQASLDVLGNTAFFTIMTSMFLPAYLPIQMFFFIISTLMIGVLLGWGIGAAAMKAALASRNEVLLASTLQRVKESAAGLADPEALYTLSIFEGVFLDLRSSAVFGCFLVVGVFFFALIRAYAPKLTLLSVFGTIALDIYCTYGPLFPFSEYTILYSLVTSIAVYIGIATVLTLTVFPETMNHSCMQSTVSQFAQIKALVAVQEAVLDAHPEDLGPGKPLLQKIIGMRAAVLAGQKALMGKSGFINLEFSYGRWNGDDVRELEEPMLTLVTRVAGLQTFARILGEPSSKAFRMSKPKKHGHEASENPSATPSTESLPGGNSNDTYLLQQIYERADAAETEHHLHMEDILPVIKDATADLRNACRDSAGCMETVLNAVNTCRWRGEPEKAAKCRAEFDESLTRLHAALTAFTETNRKLLIQPFMPLLKGAHTPEERRVLPLRSLYLSYVFATNIIVTAEAMLEVMEKVGHTMGKRQQNRLWAPKGLRAIAKIFTDKADDDAAGFGENPGMEKTDAQLKEESYRRDPDSRPPANAPQKIMNNLHHLWLWLKTAEAMFTLKYVFVSFALWLPSVFYKTAHFYYAEKGLWALIMAQTTMNIYASDQIFNYVIRLIGSVGGAIIGLVTWYIGSGSSSTGNHYGLAASTAVFLVPVMWLRLFSPLQYQAGVLLGCATWALIIGYSWVDAHLIVVGAPGVGWPVAWKRLLLVIIGSAASFIVMMLPPTSGRKAVRLRNAGVITNISEIYSFLIATWIGTQTHRKKTSAAPPMWSQDFRVKLLALADQIQMLDQMTGLAKWEGSIRGKWPAEEYESLVQTESQMIGALAQVGSALGHLEDGWRITFLHSTNVLHPNFISDVMSMFGLIAQSLRTAEPMHQVLPQTLVERLFYHRHTSFLAPGSEKKDVVDVAEMESIDYMFYCAGLVGVYHILQSLDELHQTTKTLVGEVPLRGFYEWKNEYDRVHKLT